MHKFFDHPQWNFNYWGTDQKDRIRHISSEFFAHFPIQIIRHISSEFFAHFPIQIMPVCRYLCWRWWGRWWRHWTSAVFLHFLRQFRNIGSIHPIHLLGVLKIKWNLMTIMSLPKCHLKTINRTKASRSQRFHNRWSWLTWYPAVYEDMCKKCHSMWAG